MIAIFGVMLFALACIIASSIAAGCHWSALWGFVAFIVNFAVSFVACYTPKHRGTMGDSWVATACFTITAIIISIAVVLLILFL